MQISDLHFTGEWHGKAFDPWAHHVPGLAGLVGHTKPLLRYVQDAFERLLESDPTTEIIVTGDLTAFGAAEQFEAADAYLGGVIEESPDLGLNRPNWASLSVPGNHDFWSGATCLGWGFTNRSVRVRYPLDAWVTPAFTLPNDRELVFLHLNSDADVRAMSPERTYACGSFCSAIRKLDALLADRKQREIRVLLVHHSVQHEGEPVLHLPGSRWLPVEVTLLLKHLSINDASRRELAGLVTKYDIRLVLTGHVHFPQFLGPITTGPFAEGPACWESRCGSTTQRCSASSPAVRTDNGLVVHRLTMDPFGAVFWHSEAHGLLQSSDGGAAFSPLPGRTPHSSFYIRLSP
jgi:hypothetical protein